MALLHRVVLDTNILLRGLINIHSAAGQVVDACDRRKALLLLSRPVLAEYRAVLTAPEITQRYPELTEEKVEVALRRLTYVADVVRSMRTKFEYSRDPKDEKFIELAIAGGASHIVTGDHDLLALSSGKGEATKRLRQQAPSLRVLAPGEFIRTIEI